MGTGSAKRTDGRPPPAVKLVLSRLLAPTPRTLAIISVGLLAADIASQRSGAALLSGGLSDEVAHACTGILVLWALVGWISERLLIGVLIGSVAIDLDHVPDYLGYHGFSAGTPRPYSHSLLTIAVLVVGLLITRRHAEILLGAIFGLVVHFWRDLAEPGSGVSLLWPFSAQPLSVPHASYVAIMCALVGVILWRCWVARERPGPLSPRRRSGGGADDTRPPDRPGTAPGSVEP